jgi:peptidoglycan/LPS O-acetylase OafA/YrhL
VNSGRIHRFSFLDALRGLAVSGVVLVHVTGAVLADVENSTGGGAAIATLFAAGRFGVELFFLLSGFLIAWIYQNPERSLLQFAVVRFFRIWPLWFVFSAIWALIFAMEGDANWFTALALSSVFLLWVSPEYFDSFIGGAWSIQIEVFSYAIFALTRKWHTRHLIMLAIGINVLGTIASLFPIDGVDALSAIRRLSFQTGFNFFLIGWLSARVILAKSLGERAFTWSSIGAVVPLKLVPVWVASTLFTPAIYGNPIEAFGFVALSLVVVACLPPKGFAHRILAWIGEHSYFIFFAHFVALHFIRESLSELGSGLSIWFALAIAAVATIATLVALSPIAKLSMLTLEAPFQRAGRVFFRK